MRMMAKQDIDGWIEGLVEWIAFRCICCVLEDTQIGFLYVSALHSHSFRWALLHNNNNEVPKK